jgi:hypothetical protein
VFEEMKRQDGRRERRRGREEEGRREGELINLND